VLERAVEAGIERILVPGWDIASSERALELATLHGPLIQAAVGVHPHDAGQMDEAGWRRLEELVGDSACSAVGEIGLDFHRNLSSPESQHEAFGRQLDLAAAADRPVLVHDREAHGEVTRALLAWTGRMSGSARGALHAFSGDAGMALELVAAGYLISFALPVSFRRAVGPRAAAAEIPPGSFLVETDAPYLGPDKEARNEPTTALRVAAELAQLRGSDPDAIAREAREAYDRLIVR